VAHLFVSPRNMKTRIRLAIGVFLLLSAPLASELMLYLATQQTHARWYSKTGDGRPGISWINTAGPPDDYSQTPGAHRLVASARIVSVLSLFGFLLVYPELRRGLKSAHTGQGQTPVGPASAGSPGERTEKP
jgi:hypothetical protein